MAQRVQMVDHEGLMRWNKEAQQLAIREMSGMSPKPKFIRASWLPGSEQSRMQEMLRPASALALTHPEP